VKEHYTRHDRLAVRLSVMISRLLAGESLFLEALADEFSVSERTLQRDLHERLLHLDLEHSNGQYYLSGHRTRTQTLDILAFTRKTGIATVFPGQSRRMVNAIAASKEALPCFIWLPKLRFSATFSDCFHRLLSAITQNNRIILFAEGKQYACTEPYRLIFFGATWYLVAWYQQTISVFPLTDISSVVLMDQTFNRHRDICSLTTEESFISALPHFRAIHDVQNILKHHTLPLHGNY